MPPHFSATYTPIAAAGTKGQIRHVARLMATQFTTANVGPGIKMAKKNQKPLAEDEDEDGFGSQGKSFLSFPHAENNTSYEFIDAWIHPFILCKELFV